MVSYGVLYNQIIEKYKFPTYISPLSLDNGDAMTIYEHGGTNNENTKNT